MSYKKLVSLFAVSAFALGACGTDDAAEDAATDDTDATEEVEEVEEVEEGTSTKDLLEQAKGEAGDAFPDYGLTVSGDWTTEGYSIDYVAGEDAVISVSIVTEKETYNVYLLEDGLVSEVVSDEAAVEFVVADPSADVAYLVGISPDDLGAEGDEVSEEDFARFEKIIFEEVEPAEEEE